MRFRYLAIENFRALVKLELDDLRDVVVVAGPNGSGKTQIFHAIRLLKSVYGGYQPNEWHQWFNEFNIRVDRPSPDLVFLFRERDRPIRIRAEIELVEDEVRYLREHAARIIRQRVWQEIAPHAAQAAFRGGVPAAQAQRLHGDEVTRRTEQELATVMTHLKGRSLIGELTVTPEINVLTLQNPALELVFSTYEPLHLGIVDYHGAHRNYSREGSGRINLDLQASDERMRQHGLYNRQQKYSNIKTELATGYVKELISGQAGTEASGQSVIETLRELFSTFFPGKEFLGPKARADGGLDFPVRTATGSEHDIDDLSSGEKEVLFGYLRIRNTAPHNSVLLLDEPELHLNPALLRGLPQFYHRHLGRALNNQLWLVTHSDALLRESIGQAEFSVFHLQGSDLHTPEENQARRVAVGLDAERAIIDLVGDLASYRPGAKIVIFEGGGDSEFDVRMTLALFPQLRDKINAISGGNKWRVRQLHSLLDEAARIGNLPAEFFSIVDRDSGEEPGTVQALAWDRYHIENYLLEPVYVLAGLRDLALDTEALSAEEGVAQALTLCAAETLDDLVRHDLESKTLKATRQAVRTETDRNRKDIAEAVRDTLEVSRTRLNTILDEQLTLASLQEYEHAARTRFQKDLDSDGWKSTFRGRDVLKRFVGRHVRRVKYEVFRDLVLARMRDAQHEPEGMKAVVDRLLDRK
jgi:predicted ATPase